MFRDALQDALHRRNLGYPHNLTQADDGGAVHHTRPVQLDGGVRGRVDADNDRILLHAF